MYRRFFRFGLAAILLMTPIAAAGVEEIDWRDPAVLERRIAELERKASEIEQELADVRQALATARQELKPHSIVQAVEAWKEDPNRLLRVRFVVSHPQWLGWHAPEEFPGHVYVYPKSDFAGRFRVHVDPTIGLQVSLRSIGMRPTTPVPIASPEIGVPEVGTAKRWEEFSGATVEVVGRIEFLPESPPPVGGPATYEMDIVDGGELKIVERPVAGQ